MKDKEKSPKNPFANKSVPKTSPNNPYKLIKANEGATILSSDLFESEQRNKDDN